MTEIHREWDSIMDDHTKALRDGQLIIIRALIKEIRDYKYTTISDVNGALNSHLDRLKGEQYEADAKADNFTENQFNGKV